MRSGTDTAMRLAAFDQVSLLSRLHGVLTSADLRRGFDYIGRRLPLVSQRGIFKPRQMRFLLSVRTIVPTTGSRVWYEDQLTAHRQIFSGDEAVDYAFMGTDPDAADNRWLREACENRIPVIYFLGVAPRCFRALLPTFVDDWSAADLSARLVFGLPGQDGVMMPGAAERRYAFLQVRQQLHQDVFRAAVIAAYRGRCAATGLAEPGLLDAAPIVSNRDEPLGRPIVRNGLPLSKLHHAAFGRHLIGIDPDYRLHVADRLLAQKDGPTLEALKKLDGRRIQLPPRPEDGPDRDRLARRFDQFRAAA